MNIRCSEANKRSEERYLKCSSPGTDREADQARVNNGITVPEASAILIASLTIDLDKDALVTAAELPLVG